MGDIYNPLTRLLRLTAIVVAVCLVAMAVGTWAPKPMPWVVLVPSAIPMLVALWIIVPMQRARKQ